MSTHRPPTRPHDDHVHDDHVHEERIERQIIVTGGRDRSSGPIVAAVLAILVVFVVLAIALLGDAASEMGDAIPDEVDVQVDDGDGVTTTDEGADADAEADTGGDTTN